jgi:hypothetical protein
MAVSDIRDIAPLGSATRHARAANRRADALEHRGTALLARAALLRAGARSKLADADAAYLAARGVLPPSALGRR